MNRPVEERKKTQSATEFLATYGWALIAIIVAIGVLYSLGIFRTGISSGAGGCTPVSGFSCTAPLLTQFGTLSAAVGTIGQTVTITALACSANATAPKASKFVKLSQSITLYSGQKSNFSFSCPISANSIGTAFSGYLWMQYNAQGQASSVVARVAQASINVKSPGATVTFSAAQAGTVGYSVANKITVTAPALTGANVWVCAAAEDDPSAYGLITSYIGVNDMDPDGYSAPTAGYAVGFQTSSGACLTQDQYSYQNPWAGEAVAINTGGATLVKLADSESDGNNGCGGLCQTMGLPVNVSTAMPVVIALSCGYESACDPAGYGSITGIPSGCVGTTQDTPDTGATVAIYTCNSVSSNFNVIINAPSGLPDDMAMIAYGLEK